MSHFKKVTWYLLGNHRQLFGPALITNFFTIHLLSGQWSLLLFYISIIRISWRRTQKTFLKRRRKMSTQLRATQKSTSSEFACWLWSWPRPPLLFLPCDPLGPSEKFLSIRSVHKKRKIRVQQGVIGFK